MTQPHDMKHAPSSRADVRTGANGVLELEIIHTEQPTMLLSVSQDNALEMFEAIAKHLAAASSVPELQIRDVLRRLNKALDDPRAEMGGQEISLTLQKLTNDLTVAALNLGVWRERAANATAPSPEQVTALANVDKYGKKTSAARAALRGLLVTRVVHDNTAECSPECGPFCKQRHS